MITRAKKLSPRAITPVTNRELFVRNLKIDVLEIMNLRTTMVALCLIFGFGVMLSKYM